MTKLRPFNVHAPKWYVAYFVPIDGQIVRYGLQICFAHYFTLTSIYKPILKSIRTKSAILSLKILQKITKMAIS